MTSNTKYQCDQCLKFGSGDEVRFWHHLQLTGRDFDSIPPRAVVEKRDFCSVKCLREFSAAIHVSEGPYAHLV